MEKFELEISTADINIGAVNLEDTLQKVLDWVLVPNHVSSRREDICKINGQEFKLGRIIPNLFFLKILQKYGIPIELEDFIDFKKAGELEGFINRISEKAEQYKDNISLEDLKMELTKSIVKLSDVTVKVNTLVGITVNLSSLGKLAAKNERVKELLNFDIPEGLQLNEIEKLVDANVKEINEILKKEDTVYRPLLLGGAVNARQLGQTFVNVGLKPDIEGKVIPEPVNTSFIRGLRNRQDYKTCAIGARKALVISHKQVRNSGYLSRKLLLLAGETQLDQTCECCNTKHFLPIEFKTEDIYRRYIGRYTATGEKITGDPKQMEAFVGKTIEVRSPITCSAPTGICKRCYGDLWKFNAEYNIGIISVLLLTNQLTQMLLSSKHLLMAKTEKIDWSEDFERAFSIDKNEVYPNLETTKIAIAVQDVYEDDEGDLFTNRFTAKVANKKVVITTPKKMFLNKEDAKKFETEPKEVQLYVDSNESCFFMKTRNIELGSTLAALIDLLQKPSHGGFDNDWIAVANAFVDKISESKLSLMAVHAEVILRCLVKDLATERFPDWSQDEVPEIFVDYVSNAIMNSEELSTSLSFEQIKKQLNNVKTYEKTKAGIYDPLFV